MKKVVFTCDICGKEIETIEQDLSSENSDSFGQLFFNMCRSHTFVEDRDVVTITIEHSATTPQKDVHHYCYKCAKGVADLIKEAAKAVEEEKKDDHD